MEGEDTSDVYAKLSSSPGASGSQTVLLKIPPLSGRPSLSRGLSAVTESSLLTSLPSLCDPLRLLRIPLVFHCVRVAFFLLLSVPSPSPLLCLFAFGFPSDTFPRCLFGVPTVSLRSLLLLHLPFAFWVNLGTQRPPRIFHTPPPLVPATLSLLLGLGGWFCCPLGAARCLSECPECVGDI